MFPEPYSLTGIGDEFCLQVAGSLETKVFRQILGWIFVLNLIALFALWLGKSLNLFTLILVYEALSSVIIGVLQILGSYVYRKKGIQFHYGGPPGWFDFKRFAKLKPRQRQRYKQEGKIMVVIGFILLVIAMIIHLSGCF